VTYADDLVILCRRGKAAEALQRLREIMGCKDVIRKEQAPFPPWRPEKESPADRREAVEYKEVPVPR
jgi:hypothetical protein